MKLFKNGYIINVFYTDPGLLQGLIVKQASVWATLFGYTFNISFPFWIMGFKRKEAKKSHELYLKIQKMYENGEFNDELN